MATRYSPQPKDPDTGRFIPTWKWRDSRGERSLFFVDPRTAYADPTPELRTPIADFAEALWENVQRVFSRWIGGARDDQRS